MTHAEAIRRAQACLKRARAVLRGVRGRARTSAARRAGQRGGKGPSRNARLLTDEWWTDLGPIDIDLRTARGGRGRRRPARSARPKTA